MIGKKFLCFIAVLLSTAGIVAAIDAPYLISTAVLTDSTIAIAYRNNDVKSQLFLIYRKSSIENDFLYVGSAQLITQVYIVGGLLQQTKYYFAVKTINGSDTSAFSNIDSATTKSLEHIFKLPSIRAVWDLKNKNIAVHFFDSSNCETGFRMLVSEKFGDFQEREVHYSPSPKWMGETNRVFSEVKSNEYYVIKIIMFNETDSVEAQSDTIYTLDPQQLTDNIPKLHMVEKVSDFPVQLNGWAMKAGDQIMLTEKNAPASSYSIIDVSNMEKPVFSGYKKSDQPVFEPNKVTDGITRFIVRNRFLYACNDTSVSSSEYTDTGFVLKSVISKKLLDTLHLASSYRRSFYGLQKWFNDTTLAVWIKLAYEGYDYCPGISVSFITIKDDTSMDFLTPQAGFTYEKSIGTLLKCGNHYSGVYFIDNKLISCSYGINDEPSSIEFIDYSNSYTNPKKIKYYGHRPQYSSYPVPGDSSNDYLQKELNEKMHVRYIEKYLVSDSLLPPIRYSFLDTTNKIAYLVFDTVMSIYKYDIGANVVSEYRKSGKPAYGTVAFNRIKTINPSNASIVLIFDNNFQSLQLSLYTLSGKVVNMGTRRNGRNAVIDLSKFVRGIYYIKAVVDGKSSTIRINKY